MNRLAMSAAVLVLTLMTARADWPLEPKDFRGVPFGASKQRADATLKFLSCYRHDVNETVCDDDEIHVGAVHMLPVYTFDWRNRLVSVLIKTYTEEFADMKDIFMKRYGKPANTRSGRSRTGVQFSNELLSWQGRVIDVRLLRYAGDMKWSCAQIFDRAWQERKQKGSREQDDMRWSCAELFDHSWADVMADDAKKEREKTNKKAAASF